MLIITPKKYNWMHRKEPPPQPQLTNTNNRCEEVNSENIQASAWITNKRKENHVHHKYWLEIENTLRIKTDTPIQYIKDSHSPRNRDSILRFIRGKGNYETH